MPNQLSFDGKGINGPDDYRSRIATFTNSDTAEKYGNLFAASQKILSALENLLSTTELNLDDMENHTTAAIVDAMVAIKEAKGEA